MSLGSEWETVAVPIFIAEIVWPKEAIHTPDPGAENRPEFVTRLLEPFGARLLRWYASTGGQSWLAVVDAPSPELMKAAVAAAWAKGGAEVGCL